MREIKFRAWDKNDKKMCYTDEHGLDRLYYEYIMLTFGGHVWAIGEDSDTNYDDDIFSWVNASDMTERFVLMQYTGLKDKNSKEIYEGDICRYWMDNVWKIGDIFYRKGGYAIRVFKMGNESTNIIFNFQSFIPMPGRGNTMNDKFEVIGNIYENPELLESVK